MKYHRFTALISILCGCHFFHFFMSLHLFPADIETVVCDTQEKVECLLRQAELTPKLKRIIVIKDVSEEVKEKARKANVMLMKFSELEVSLTVSITM